jgi:chaperone required for assembly of F1-ATPase
MPVTRSANSAIDTVGPNRAEVVATVAAYGDSDHVCYRADSPAELVARQAEKLDPLLNWAAAELGARLRPVTGVIHAPQDPAALDRLATLVAEFGAFELAAFHDLVALTGSLVIGFAAARAHMPDDALWALSRIDETWQAEQWGEDDEAADLAALKRQAFLEAARIFRLARAAE